MKQHEPFAHLHTYTDIGQVVVLKQSADEGGHPEIRLFVNPPSEELGVCSLALGFEPEEGDESEGWDRCDKAFDTMADPMRVHALLERSPLFTMFNEEQDDG